MFRIRISTCVVALLMGCAASIGCVPAAVAQDLPTLPVRGDSNAVGALTGRVVDADRNVPLSGASIRLPALARGDLSHGDGTFHLHELPPGLYLLSLQRVGYAPIEQEVTIPAGGTVDLILRLRPAALEVPGIVITAGGRAQRADEVFQPVSVLSGAGLQRRLETSLAATLASEPGISQRYNGPAAAQPVIRGLSGDRVLVLEDGNRTGDVSSTAADHAVSVDPLGAERIEVVRGAASLLYGSNALGGVINVIREDVPRTLPEHTGGTVTLQGESVNSGIAGATAMTGALGSVAWRVAASGRMAGDTRTALGDLPSTDLQGHSIGAGSSWIGPDGFMGLAIRQFTLDYGVPGTFGGQTIPGAHEGGVDIEMRRVTGTGTVARLTDFGPFSSVEMNGAYTWYRHREIEPPGLVGTEFGQLSGSGRLVARHHHAAGALQREGAVGLQAVGKDFSVAGSSTGTRPAREYSIAGFGYEELAMGRARVQVGGRYDWTRIEPLDTRPGQIGEVRTRDFGAVSASLSGLVDLVPGLTTGVTVARAYRTPAIEELFSDGPHLADYSYDIGNPALDPEIGIGVDLFARFTRPGVRGEFAVFRNHLDGFIHHRPTGELDPRFGRFPVYRATQADAVLVGGEGMVEWEAARSFVVRGQSSYVRGTRTEDDAPIPAMPPLEGSLSARYERHGWFASAEWRVAAAQRRVAEHEATTDGHSLVDLGGGIRWTTGGRLQSLTLGITNLTDEAWRDHLSRIRAVAPQPGRNVRLLYHIEL